MKTHAKEPTLPREELDWRRLYPPAFATDTHLPVFIGSAASGGERGRGESPSSRRRRFIPTLDGESAVDWRARLESARASIPHAVFTLKKALHSHETSSGFQVQVPMKRGRGRPPKHAPRDDAVVVDVAEFGVQRGGTAAYFRYQAESAAELDRTVEYDMDEQDIKWLTALSNARQMDGLEPVSEDVFETIMDRLEKEWFDLTKAVQKWHARCDESVFPDELACEVCGDSETSNANVLVLCDGCDLAVHQECYGVPHVPEGPWLCRRCMLVGTSSSSLSLSSAGGGASPTSLCVLCPWPDGALKQTCDRRWVHSVCAHWSTEAHILNPIYQEPVDVAPIHRQRWRLRCVLCRVAVGAPIQCSFGSCSCSYHPLCARKLGLYLDYRTRESFCWRHTPASHQARVDAAMRRARINRGADSNAGESGSSSENSDVDIISDAPEPQQTRPLQGDNNPNHVLVRIGSVPPLHVIRRTSKPRLRPVAPKLIIDSVAANRLLPKSVPRALLCRIARYWSLKREARRGTPLIRRLQLEPWSAPAMPASDDMHTALQKEHNTRRYLLDDLRRLCELVGLVSLRERKRLAQLHYLVDLLALLGAPLTALLTRFTEALSRVDAESYFAAPVDTEQVPDYLQIVSRPMDLGTLRSRIPAYKTLDEYWHDLSLIWTNAFAYNEPSTVYYKAASALKRAAEERAGLLRRQLGQLSITTSADRLSLPASRQRRRDERKSR